MFLNLETLEWCAMLVKGVLLPGPSPEVKTPSVSMEKLLVPAGFVPSQLLCTEPARSPAYPLPAREWLPSQLVEPLLPLQLTEVHSHPQLTSRVLAGVSRWQTGCKYCDHIRQELPWLRPGSVSR